MNNFFEDANILSKKMSSNRGSPLNYFLSPYIERFIKKMEAEMGMYQMGANASPLAPESNPLANAIRGGMSDGSNMETTDN